jgi:hypothetical protein
LKAGVDRPHISPQPPPGTNRGGQALIFQASTCAPCRQRIGRTGALPALAEDELDVFIDLLQWPAMAVTVIAAWLIGSLRPGRRFVGFCCFLLSNLLWVIWGWHAEAWALIVLQVCLAAMNIRGVKKNDDPAQPEPDTPRA